MRRRGKYNATPTLVDGIRFDSKKEARRYEDLRILERAGVIRDIELQPRFAFQIGGSFLRYLGSDRKLTYSADFRYTETESELAIVEDVKSGATAAKEAYKIKRALMRWIHGITVQEV